MNLAWVVPDAGLHTTAVIERKTGAGAYSVVAEVSDAMGYTDQTGLAVATEYTYRVKLVGSAGTSAYSSAVTVTTLLGGVEVSTSGLRLWLAADAGTQGVGPLTTWHDAMGGSVYASQSTEGSKPQVVANQLNGRPVVRFDGNDYSRCRTS